MVFRLSLALVGLFLGWGIVAPSQLSSITQFLLNQTLDRFGWFYLLSMLTFLLFTTFLALSRFGQIRLGGIDAKPEFSYLSWFAMLFAAGMGIGLVFYGAAEPLSHYASPPAGVKALTAQAGREAMRQAFFHWGLHPWAAYSIVALALAYTQFNLKRPALLSAALEPLLGHHAQGGIGHSIDTLAILCTAFGVATSLGLGTLQITTGLQVVFGIQNDTTTQLLVIAVTTVVFLASAMTGLQRGIQWLSNANLGLAAALALLVLVCGPTLFILDVFTTTLGSYLNNLLSTSLKLTPFVGDNWVKDWTVFYWAWWITWSPFVGLFIARISRGRTIREFVLGVMLAPTLLSFAWFAIFGGTGLHQAIFDGAPMVAAVQADIASALFNLFANLPMAQWLSLIALLLLAVFFVTSADSATYVLGMLSSGGAANPSGWLKMCWGLMISGIASVLLLSGGLKGLQAMVIITALPFAVLMLGLCLALYRVLDADIVSQQQRELKRRAKVDGLLAEATRT
ncbi:BCCT family transporter [Chitinimonas sp. BJB300]|uniref:BCCT family transporter n=1 Tax=Chitinimonas sp. BJB300 TaxID=1559339 RepID=UPI000C11D3E5|nr:BCCT family transporter [Chitinimonas sp. BJB300]PHV10512.1 glycine/betaine ABC transporter permease [Chitinimonas sp. BJB300]TSJ90759.1 BCCT family transporter [Chitinimonas sp. BJB300]